MTSNIDKATADATFALTREWEKLNEKGRPDRIGVPTLGYGFALVIKGSKGWVIRENLEDDLEKVGVAYHDGHKNRLQEIATALEKGDYDDARKHAESFSIGPINDGEAEKLFRLDLPRYAGDVRRAIGDAAYDKLDPRRRAALIDTALMAPKKFRKVAPGIRAALDRDDMAAAAEELAKLRDGTRQNIRPRDNAEFFRNPDAASRIRVRQGGALSKIAEEAGRRIGRKVGVQEIMDLNGIKDRTLVRSGRWLKLPEPAGSDVGAPGALPAGPGRKSDAGGAPVRGATRPAEKAEAPETPEMKSIKAAMAQPVDPVDHILVKPTTMLTTGEVDTMIGHDGYWPQSQDPRSDALQDKTRAFFETFHERGVTITPNERPTPLRTASGAPLEAGRGAVAKALGRIAGDTGLEPAVRGFQKTLNRLGLGSGGRLPPYLTVDGAFGPKTLARLDEELVRAGPSALVDALRRAA